MIHTRPTVLSVALLAGGRAATSLGLGALSLAVALRRAALAAQPQVFGAAPSERGGLGAALRALADELSGPRVDVRVSVVPPRARGRS